MANNSNEIRLKIVIDGKEAVGTINLTDDEVKQLGKSFKDAALESDKVSGSLVTGFTKARNIMQGFKETFNLIKTAFGASLDAYAQQEQAEIKLQTALKQTGNFTDANFKSMKDYASQLQATTLFGDEQTIRAMAMLQVMGLNNEMTKQATMQAANLATVMGTDLSSAVRVMGDLFGGDATMIKRYVKGLDDAIIKSGDASKIIAHLNERIGDQAVNAANSGSGAIKQMEMAVGDLRENVGMMLSKALFPLVSVLKNVITWLNNTHPQLAGIIGLIGTLTAVLITLRVAGLIPTIAQLVAARIAVIAFFTSLGPIGWAIIGISAVATAWLGVSAAIGTANKEMDAAVKKHQNLLRLKEINTQLEKETDKTRKFLLEQERAQILSQFLMSSDKDGGKKPVKDMVDKQKELYKDLMLESKKGQEKELLALKQKYEEQKVIAAGNQKILKLLEENYQRDVNEIQIKWLRIQRDEREKFWIGVRKTEAEEKEKRKNRFKMETVDEPEKKTGAQLVAEVEEMERVNEQIARLNPMIDLQLNLIESVKQGWQSAGQAMSQSIGNSIRLFGQANSLLQVFLNTLAQVAVQQASMAVFNVLSGGIPGLLGLADGGVVTQPTVAMIGEGREPEAVLPLSKLAAMIRPQPVAVNTVVNLKGEASVGLNKLYFRLKKVEDLINKKY